MNFNLLECATQYAVLGFSVFPLQRSDKRPATPNGVKDATRDIERIKSWWNANPSYNIGLALGSASGGVFAIDIDIDSDKGVDGFDSLRTWEHEHGELPESAMTLTGRGGNHILFRSSSTIGNRVCVLEGIDIRGEGGYIVAPPSIHPNGTPYTWENDLDEYGIADADENVLSLCSYHKEKQEGFSAPESEIKEGGRNDFIYKLACSLQGKGLSDEAIRVACKQENQDKCSPPLSDQELNRTIKSALGKKKGKKPRTPTPALDTFSALDLLEEDPAPPDMVVEGIMPVGLGLLCGPPKIGKSWLSLDLAVSISTQSDVLGLWTFGGSVLYLALEDNKARINSRLKFVSDGRKVTSDLIFCTNCEQISTDESTGLMAQLNGFLLACPTIKCILVDTLQMVAGNRGRKDAYEYFYSLFQPLKRFATNHNLSILLVHHTRKSMGFESSPFDNILGSTSILGAVDFAWVLEHKNDCTTLHTTGRDIDSQEISVSLDQSTCRWVNLGSPEDRQRDRLMQEYRKSPIVATIKYKMEEAKEDGEDCFYTTSGDLRQTVLELNGKLIGESERNFSTICTCFDPLLLQDGILHVRPKGNTSHNGISARWHIYKYVAK